MLTIDDLVRVVQMEQAIREGGGKVRGDSDCDVAPSRQEPTMEDLFHQSGILSRTVVVEAVKLCEGGPCPKCNDKGWLYCVSVDGTRYEAPGVEPLFMKGIKSARAVLLGGPQPSDLTPEGVTALQELARDVLAAVRKQVEEA